MVLSLCMVAIYQPQMKSSAFSTDTRCDRVLDSINHSNLPNNRFCPMMQVSKLPWLLVAVSAFCNSISDAVLKSTVEIGGACVAKEHRNLEALSLLWKGLANYLLWSGNKYFLGCTTLPTDDIVQSTCAYNYFQKNNLIHLNFLVYPQSQFYCDIGSYSPDVVQLKLPTILQIYLASGAKICSLPALDKDYKCIDFLTIFDSTNFAPVRSLMSTTRSTLSSLVKI
jgi:hypothetical protein